MKNDETVSQAAVDWTRLAAQVAAAPDPVLELRRHQAAQWGSGAGVPVEEYLARFPSLTEEDALVLILGEVQIARELGWPTTVDEYRDRFPALAADLDMQFALLGALADSTREPEDGLASTAPAGSAARDGTPRPAIPGYELAEEIGRGGMGVVYRARDLALDRSVAVKILQNRYPPDGAAAVRFVDEARITGQLQHPGVPPIYQVGQLPDGRPYLAMKLIRGQTLAELLAVPAADHSRLVAVFEQVCQTVGFAHAQGVIHRDLKPANVMVGKYGEAQVMDWGLAKVLTATAPEPPRATVTVQAADTEIRSRREPDSGTLAGDILGTPAFMPPEQAGGEIDKIDRRSDVFGLGAVLCSILTGAPPYAGRTVEEVKLKAVRGQLADAHARLSGCGAEPELIALCKRCLAPDPGVRPSDAGAVARAVGDLRAAADERARRAEIDRVKAEGERATAEARAQEEAKTRQVAEEKAREQQKRRRVQLALAAFAVLVAIGGGVAANVIQRERAEKQHEADRLTAGRQRAEDQLVAETVRQTDLRAADAAARERQRMVQREARAGALTDALATAETVAVPRVIDDLKEYSDLTGARLRAQADRPVGTKPGLHARLALLADDPNRATELGAYLPACRSDELLTIREALGPHAGAVAAALWSVLTDAKADAGKRVRAACALAGLAPTDARWAACAPAVAELVVMENPLAAAVWFEALEPVREALLPALAKRYIDARARLRGGKLDEVRSAAEVSGYDLAAAALARYTRDRPAAVELAMLVDPRHVLPFVPAVAANKGVAVPRLKAELAKKGLAGWSDDAHEALSRRRAQAAALLLTIGETEAVWPLFAFPADGDPTARSYLLARLVDLGADPLVLARRFEVEPDVSARRALLVALGGFPTGALPAAPREAMGKRLLAQYRDQPDPGLHGALDWLLRQKWGMGRELAAIDAELGAETRRRVAGRALTAAAVPVGLPAGLVGPLLPAPKVADERDWFVNGEVQTFSVVRGPVEFTRGSPKTEPGRNEVNEPAHRKTIARTFAVGTKEVTTEQFLRFRPKHDWIKRISPDPDAPAVSVTWYEAAEYCNWLSAREGIPEAEWCYEPNAMGVYDEGMRIKAGHLKQTGYRLPTEAEWEYACRAGAVTSRYHGRAEDLLPRYDWFGKNADERTWPVGRLRPNELGLFDTLGNAWEWVEDPALLYAVGQADDIENAKALLVSERFGIVLRGATIGARGVNVRCAFRGFSQPRTRSDVVGFRVARTLN